MTLLAPPSRNPTVDGKLKSVLRFVFMKLLQSSVDDMLPAITVAYNRATNMASVQPLISILTTLNEIVPRGQISKIPVQMDGGGGFMLSFPLNPNGGDLGWIKANDRDISLFTQLWQMVLPNTKRMHSFEDAVFIPNVPTNFTVVAADSGNVVLQRIDGSMRFSMGNGNTCITDQAAYSQSVNAVLDTQSVTRAFKVPRMTEGQRDAISSPVGGFIVYVTDSVPNPKFSFYTDGIGWS